MLQSPHRDSLGLPDPLPVSAAPGRDAIMVLVHELATSLGKAIDAKDSHTMAHSEEVAEMARILAGQMGLEAPVVECVHVAGHLHDIGKIGVPDAVLGKPGPLTDAEWKHMQAHPTIGAAILAPLTCFAQTGVVEMVRAHHERIDGRGYPLGLSGQDIPLGARIIAVADSLSAMLQTRPYRPAMTFDNAAREIVRCAGTQFDPDVVVALLDATPIIYDLIRACRCKGKQP